MSSTNPRPPIGPRPSFFRRVPLAFGAFFRTIANLDFAARIDEMSQQDGPPPAVVPPPAPPPRPLKEVSPDAALQLLSLLQREGRLIDFTRENLANYSDADIGAAARVVHEGCSKVLREHFTIEPVRPARRLRCGSGAPDRQCGRRRAVQRQHQPSRLARHRSAPAEAGRQA